jgi:hypothetical protein
MKRIIYFILLIIIIPNNLIAQNISGQRKFKNYVTIGFTPTYNNKVRFDDQEVSLLKSKRLFSGELHIGYNHIWNNGWGLDSKINIGIIPLNVSCSINTSDQSIFYPYVETLNENLTDYPIEHSYLSLDLLCVKQWLFNEQNALNLNFGLRLYYFLFSDAGLIYESTTYELPNDIYASALQFYLIYQPSQRFISSIVLKPGYSRKLRNNDVINLSLVFNYSPFNILKNSNSFYEFYGLGYDSYGTLSLGVSFIGLSIEYGISCY